MNLSDEYAILFDDKFCWSNSSHTTGNSYKKNIAKKKKKKYYDNYNFLILVLLENVEVCGFYQEVCSFVQTIS